MGDIDYKFIIVSCCRKNSTISVNLKRFSEGIIYTNIFGNLRESSDSFFNDILLENIDKEEVVYVTIGNPAFCLALHLTGVHFDQSKLEKQVVSDCKKNYMRDTNKLQPSYQTRKRHSLH